jgi:hypothetical protein
MKEYEGYCELKWIDCKGFLNHLLFKKRLQYVHLRVHMPEYDVM